MSRTTGARSSRGREPATRALVRVTRPSLGTVLVEIECASSQRLFVPLLTENQLDNDPPSIHGDSVQLYAIAGERNAGMLLVPEGSHVGKRLVEGWNNELSVDARWRPTSSGYHIDATLYIDYRTPEFYLDVLVNEIVPGRARLARTTRDVRRGRRIRLSSG